MEQNRDASKDQNCDFNLSSASVCSGAISRDDGYFSRTGGSFQEEHETEKQKPEEHLSRVEETSSRLSESDADPPLEEREISQEDIRLWDKISKTVESFSQNTMTFLSWIEELDEISHNEEIKSMFFASHTSRKQAIARQIERVFEEVAKDAATLVKNVPGEKNTIAAVLKRLNDRSRKLGVSVKPQKLPEVTNIPTNSRNPAECGKQSKIPEKLRNELENLPSTAQKERNALLSEESKSLEESPPAVDTKPTSLKKDFNEPELKEDSESESISTLDVLEEEYLPQSSISDPITRRTVSLRANWRQFLTEYKTLRKWLRKMKSVIDWAEQRDLPISYLEKIFKNYFFQFLRAKPKRECLNIKANYIGTMFPEIREQTDAKMDKIDEIWRSLMIRLSYYLAPETSPEKKSSDPTKEESQELSSEESESQENSQKESFVAGTEKPNHIIREPTDASECESLTESQSTDDTSHVSEQEGRVQLSDFSFHQIRDKLSFDSSDSLHNSRSSQRKTRSLQSDKSTLTPCSSGQEDAVEFSNRIETFHNWLSGSEEDAYNKDHCVKIGWEPQRLYKLLESYQNLRVRLEEERSAVDALVMLHNKTNFNANNEADMLWSTLMLQQRYHSLLLFTIDMECILERRIDIVTKIFNFQSLVFLSDLNVCDKILTDQAAANRTNVADYTNQRVQQEMKA